MSKICTTNTKIAVTYKLKEFEIAIYNRLNIGVTVKEFEITIYNRLNIGVTVNTCM